MANFFQYLKGRNQKKEKSEEKGEKESSDHSSHLLFQMKTCEVIQDNGENNFEHDLWWESMIFERKTSCS